MDLKANTQTSVNGYKIITAFHNTTDFHSYTNVKAI